MKKHIFAFLIGLMALGLPAVLQAQERVEVKGQVLDAATGEPVLNASVLVKGSTNGTISDLDGNFTLSAAVGTQLEIASLGYDSALLTVKSGMGFQKVLLKTSSEFLEETVVVGYGTVKKENLSGAVDQVSEEVFAGRPVANATQMLQGAVPNLNINLENGKPGQSADFNIRGATSIGSGGSALVLIDGVEGEPNMLNPNDIESVSVLKDAAAAAIYGSRATFGVILITTKDPSRTQEKFTVTYSGNVSVLQPTAIPDIVDDGYVYSKIFYEAYFNYNKTAPTGINKSQPFSTGWMDDFRLRKREGNPVTTTVDADGNYTYYGNTNYYDALYKKAVFAHSHNISVSGSTGRLSYYLSGRIYDYNGLFNFNPDVYRTFNIRG
ncbi:MAG: TonB-dependent receptor plug domain-containing protein, partial [Bacteroidales bacterium]|nr:TonB-dependent receptor plug domain-containing protein [Bacteroidales bacterium]